MLSILIRYFCYGFVLFVGVWLVLYAPFYPMENENNVSYMAILIWGAVGGVSFLVAYKSGWCLKKMIIGKK
ncbi:MAG: hypothetical protein ABW157_21130 [Candidatus Thiodiazotropha sp. LLP2]